MSVRHLHFQNRPGNRKKRKDIQRDRIDRYLKSADCVWTPPLPYGEDRFYNAGLVPVYHCDELECDQFPWRSAVCRLWFFHGQELCFPADTEEAQQGRQCKGYERKGARKRKNDIRLIV